MPPSILRSLHLMRLVLASSCLGLMPCPRRRQTCPSRPLHPMSLALVLSCLGLTPCPRHRRTCLSFRQLPLLQRPLTFSSRFIRSSLVMSTPTRTMSSCPVTFPHKAPLRPGSLGGRAPVRPRFRMVRLVGSLLPRALPSRLVPRMKALARTRRPASTPSLTTSPLTSDTPAGSAAIAPGRPTGPCHGLVDC